MKIVNPASLAPLALLFCAGAALAAAGTTAAGTTAGETVGATADRLIEFTILDQFDAEHTEADFAGKVMVVFWGDREGNEPIERWDRTLRRKLKRELAAGTVDLRTVAHTQGAPGFIKGMIKSSFSDDPEAWALMDWDGVFAAAYAPVEKQCNILVFGRQGALLTQVATTKLEQAVLDEVLAAVRQGLAGDEAPGQPSRPVQSNG
jgi:predicted transcriptional regulator